MQSKRLDGDLLVVAGEASGDLHGARLLAELHRLNPDLRAYGMGGRELAAAGAEVLADSSEISVVGISEVFHVLPRARKIYHELLAEVDRRRTRNAVLIDFPDFNLRLAKDLKRRGVKVLYYISPQIWAWRRGRVRTIARWIDRMLVILPFEVEFYRQHGIEAVHVGHPLVDEVPEIGQRWDEVQTGDTPYVIVLLPGSRNSEIESNLPVMLAAAKRMEAWNPCEFRLIKAPTVKESVLAHALSSSGLRAAIVSEDRFTAIAGSHLAICASGTATLEVGLLRTPMVMVYRVSSWTYLLGRILVRLPHIALVNLVLDRRVVPELIQQDATPEMIAATATEILTDRDRIRCMREDLAELRGLLGDSGASGRAATRVWDEINLRQEVR